MINLGLPLEDTVKLALGDQAIVLGHDGLAGGCTWEDKLCEQQEQLEREMQDARKMVSSLQVTLMSSPNLVWIASRELVAYNRCFCVFYRLSFSTVHYPRMSRRCRSVWARELNMRSSNWCVSLFLSQLCFTPNWPLFFHILHPSLLIICDFLCSSLSPISLILLLFH